MDRKQKEGTHARGIGDNNGGAYKKEEEMGFFS
jgi:hypothetical protein